MRIEHTNLFNTVYYKVGSIIDLILQMRILRYRVVKEQVQR